MNPRLKDFLEWFAAWVIVLGAISAIVVAFFFITSQLNIRIPTGQERYERAYARCMAQETLNHEQCHDIALREAYPTYRN